jgi:hypothetical protein
LNLLTLPFKLPLLPLQGVLRLAQLIEEEAERQLADPARIRRELEAIEQARQSGEITDEQAAELQGEVVMGYTQAMRGAAPAADSDEG